ncbi:hypothetical protein PB1A_0195 [Leuconostoc inhae]|uniref:Uncharacterized protein n=2 Tax=Leuconostoc TaxID=1243 RepID=A0AAN2QWQ2_9LACO|nr:conserved domain protein, possible pseudogene [Leuconostoc gasicomitatum LMG 18811]CUW04710.1 hypothetical protein C122C_1997 [Leuconostoc gasicomitatum]CUW06887.1 hypothetical protein PB1A_0195 [Leuconostoc inhae]CUW11086.1 hypothetical protein KSL4_1188 [Leuconostoc inhae]CUW19269.1 hypothetical protein C120C_1732 [Leuconostoc inhae]
MTNKLDLVTILIFGDGIIQNYAAFLKLIHTRYIDLNIF